MTMKKAMTALLMLILGAAWGWAQQSDVNSLLGHPQMILHSGKIVSMDDDSFEARVGTITQAMAVRDGKILATGSNDVIRALAGPETQTIDLKGRTVLPSLILTHEHPTDWMFQEPRAITHVLPNDDMIIHRWLPSIPPKQQLARFETVMQEAVAKAKPGQWILLSFNWGPNYEWAIEMGTLFRDSIRKEYLDQLAPNNPVKVKNGFITSVVNQKAIDELRLVHPTLSVMAGAGERGVEAFLKTGGGFSRPMEPDVMFRGKTPVLANLLKAEMELWARYGITTFGSSPYAYHNFQALDYLDKKGEMPGRFAWGYTGPDWSTDILRYLAGMVGHGTDHLWLVGAWGATGSRCMSVPMKPEWEQMSKNFTYGGTTQCNFAPGTPGRELLERIIESGLRIATMHTGGDKDIDYYMDAIEAASRRAGFTLEQIRAKRHAFDHGEGAPRPNQIPRIKKLGMLVSEINTNVWEPHRGASVIAKQYGVEYTSWVVPRKSLTDAGVRTSFEIDRPMPQKIFFFVLKGINRYHDFDKRVYGPDQRTDRIIQLKALTRWGAYYLLREDRLGTLEPGKFADFIVLDRDFLTVPEDQIPDIQVLMTSVGGKVVHLISSLAGEVGMEPVGATTWTEEIPEGW